MNKELREEKEKLVQKNLRKQAKKQERYETKLMRDERTRMSRVELNRKQMDNKSSLWREKQSLRHQEAEENR